MKGENIMNNTEFANRAKEIATKYKTVYMWGTFGHKVTDAIIESKARQYPTRYSESRQAALKKLVGKGYWAFDCVGLIKGILWGWKGDDSKSQGGAKYKSNLVPDYSANTMFKQCTEKSADFTDVEVGEAVWLDGHIGIYIGDGLAVEATTKGEDEVKITACNCDKAGYERRDWEKHGKLPYVEYVVKKAPKKTLEEVAKDVLNGKYGNGSARKRKLISEGYDYAEVQAKVNELLEAKSKTKKTTTEIAKEVLDGKWGNGSARKKALTDAGYNYATIQRKVNELSKKGE